jgi:hypothetical protein
MKKKIENAATFALWMGVVLIPVVMGACSAQGLISATNIKPAVDVLTEEHAGYVQADASLSDTEKAKRIRTGQMLKEVVANAAQPDEVVQ